jgi:hypothetical protein
MSLPPNFNGSARSPSCQSEPCGLETGNLKLKVGKE